MNSASLSDAIKEAYATAPSALIVLNTLEIRHESIATPFYLIQAQQNMMLTLGNGQVVEFLALPFDLTLPKAGDDGLQELNITIDNVDLQISDFLKKASTFASPVEILFSPYLSNDLTTPQMVPPLRLFMKDASITTTEISVRATMADLINKKFPRELYTRERFPGLGE